MHNFCEGQLFLYRKLGMYHMLLQHYMEHDDFPNILETCQKFGDDDANLWVQALTYFGARLDFPQLYIEQILAQIEQRNLLPPLVVVQILARNRKMPLSIVKAYITRRLRQEKQQIEMDEREIRKLRDDTEKMRTEIAKLKTRCVCFAAVSVLKATAACCTFCVSRSLSLSLSFSPPPPSLSPLLSQQPQLKGLRHGASAAGGPICEGWRGPWHVLAYLSLPHLCVRRRRRGCECEREPPRRCRRCEEGAPA